MPNAIWPIGYFFLVMVSSFPRRRESSLLQPSAGMTLGKFRQSFGGSYLKMTLLTAASRFNRLYDCGRSYHSEIRISSLRVFT